MSSVATTVPLADQILDYWLGELDQDGMVRDGSKYKLWYAGGPSVDQHIHDTYADHIRRAAKGEYDGWMADNRTAVALIILTDQFSRNAFRGSAESFASDAKGLQVTRTLIDSGRIEQLKTTELFFALHPLEHSERLADQEECVAQFALGIKRLGGGEPALALSDRIIAENGEAADAGVSGAHKHLHAGYVFAQKHHADIKRFGRFPHRNEMLGRTSTDEEKDYLAKGGGFAQKKTNDK